MKIFVELKKAEENDFCVRSEKEMFRHILMVLCYYGAVTIVNASKSREEKGIRQWHQSRYFFLL
jgi:hypothetical protein